MHALLRPASFQHSNRIALCMSGGLMTQRDNHHFDVRAAHASLLAAPSSRAEVKIAARARRVSRVGRVDSRQRQKGTHDCRIDGVIVRPPTTLPGKEIV